MVKYGIESIYTHPCIDFQSGLSITFCILNVDMDLQMLLQLLLNFAYIRFLLLFVHILYA